jgi:VanZ family protein
MRKRHTLLLLLIALTLCFIWGNSLMPATVSDALSTWVKDLLSGLFGGIAGAEDFADHFVRKLAHASEFALLGAELAVLVSGDVRKRLTLLALCGVGAALADETIQLFAAGRSSQVTDIWIDLCGYTAGVLLSLLIIAVARRSRRRKEQAPGGRS